MNVVSVCLRQHEMFLLLTPYVKRRPCGFSTIPAPLNKPWKKTAMSLGTSMTSHVVGVEWQEPLFVLGLFIID